MIVPPSAQRYPFDEKPPFDEQSWPVDIYGRPMTPDDPFLPVARQRGRWGQVGTRGLSRPLGLGRGVGRHMPNDPTDVAALEVLLGQAGYYDLERRQGPTGYWSPTIEMPLRDYQKDHGLTIDGWAASGGETEATLLQNAGLTITADVPGRGVPRSNGNGPPLPGSQLPNNPMLQPTRGAPLTMPRPPLLPPRPAPAPAPTSPRPQVAPQPLPNRPLSLPAQPVDPNAPQDKTGMQPPADRTPEAVGDYLIGDLETTLGKHPGSLGSADTQFQNKILADECRDVMEKEFMLGYLGKHTNGAVDGGGGRLTEEVVRPENQSGRNFLGSVRPDFTWEITLPDGTKETIRLNSASTKKDGTLTKREAEALRKLREYTQKDFTDWIAKEKGGFSIPGFTKKAREKCREIFGRYIDVRRVY